VESASVGSAVLSAAEDSAFAVGAAVAVASGSLAALSSVGFDPQPANTVRLSSKALHNANILFFNFINLHLLISAIYYSPKRTELQQKMHENCRAAPKCRYQAAQRAQS
jgi:hypothetical protein